MIFVSCNGSLCLQEALLNGKNGGFIGAKLKYLRGIERTHLLNENQANAVIREVQLDVPEVQHHNDEEDFEFLKSCVVNAENMTIIKQKLKSTIEYRVGVMNDQNIEFLEQFPYFFTNPELVSKSQHIIINKIF